MSRLIKIAIAALIIALAPSAIIAQKTQPQNNDTVNAILALAQQGNAQAQNEVGSWYYTGRNRPRDFKEALKWWFKSAQQGNAQGLEYAGMCYQYGRGIAADSLKAAQLYEASIKRGNTSLLLRNVEQAKKGNLFSNMLLASCYQKGIGVERDSTKATPFLTIAALGHSVTAQRELGLSMLKANQLDKAAAWFRQGAAGGNADCAYYYGTMLLKGTGVKRDKNLGADYMLQAAYAGLPQAMYQTANCYLTGEGLTRNADQAVKWYNKAADKGIGKAQWMLASCYRQGVGTPVNYEQALHWYTEATRNGYAETFKKLITDSIPNSPFVSYLNGLQAYRQKDFTKALRDFKTVEKAGVTDGQIMTGLILTNPAYSHYDLKKGVQLIEQAARSNARAMYLMAAFCESGRGTEKSMPRAIEYLEHSAEMDYAPAQCALGDLYFEGRGVEHNIRKAMEWYAKAAAQNQLSNNAVRRYALCREKK
ncbi:MAG: sel1 repeat family protein [Muribaculaceae bacterium]|nr:sel1 repeat family protein [Muribaculaceae bacterium]